MTDLILLAGVPGVGKTTWAHTFFDLKNAIISSDEIRKRLAGTLRSAHDADIRPWDVFYREIGDRLKHNVDVVADATFLTRRHRERAREVADRHKADLHLVLFKDLQVADERNKTRDDDVRVPPKVMRDMEDLYYDTLHEIKYEPYKTVTMIAEFN